MGNDRGRNITDRRRNDRGNDRRRKDGGRNNTYRGGMTEGMIEER